MCEYEERVYEYEGTTTAHMPITFRLQADVNPELLKGTQLIAQAWVLLILPSSKLSAVLWAAWSCPFCAQKLSLDGLISDVIRSQGFLGLKINLGTRFAQAVQSPDIGPFFSARTVSASTSSPLFIFNYSFEKTKALQNFRLKSKKPKNLPVSVTVFNSILTWNANLKASSQEHKEFLIILCCYRQEDSGMRTNQMSSVLLETLLSKGTDIKSLVQWEMLAASTGFLLLYCFIRALCSNTAVFPFPAQTV